jgi:hypothetical protein
MTVKPRVGYRLNLPVSEVRVVYRALRQGGIPLTNKAAIRNIGTITSFPSFLSGVVS